MMVNHKSQREAKLNLQLALFNDIHMNRKLDNFAHMVCLIFSQIQNWHRARFLCPFFKLAHFYCDSLKFRNCISLCHISRLECADC